VAYDLDAIGRSVVVVDSDPERAGAVPAPFLVVNGDAADDDVLRRAGIDRAGALIAAVATDAVNLFIALSGRSLRPDLFIVARAREESSVEKLLRAGADRVVNPQEIGGARIAAFVARPRVTEFLDVVMHSRGTELNLEQIMISARSELADRSLHGVRVRDRTGALVLAIHDPERGLISNPSADVTLRAGQELIAIGTPTQLHDLMALADADISSAERDRRS
jgi:voltage-gated potassium channel